MPAPATTAFTPAFDGYAARVHASFARQGVMALMGATLTVMHGWPMPERRSA